MLADTTPTPLSQPLRLGGQVSLSDPGAATLPHIHYCWDATGLYLPKAAVVTGLWPLVSHMIGRFCGVFFCLWAKKGSASGFGQKKGGFRTEGARMGARSGADPVGSSWTADSDARFNRPDPLPSSRRNRSSAPATSHRSAQGAASPKPDSSLEPRDPPRLATDVTALRQTEVRSCRVGRIALHGRVNLFGLAGSPTTGHALQPARFPPRVR